jgi:hypothetical protein
MKRQLLLPAVLAFALLSVLPLTAHAQVFTENFDDTVPDLLARGWVGVNNSGPVVGLAWFQPGITPPFPAHQGPELNSFMASNFEAVDDLGTISNWLLSPSISFRNGDSVSFFSRTTGLSPDRLELRLSTNLASTNVGGTALSVGDFSTVLLTINPLLDTTSYPTSWTQFTATLSGLPVGGAAGRLGFRHFVTDGGASGTNSDFIGIDTVRVTRSSGATAPEPTTALLLLSGVLILRRQKARNR